MTILISSLLLFIYGISSFLFGSLFNLEISVTLLFILGLFFSYSIFGRVNILFLYFLSFGVFLMARIILSVIFSYDWSFGYMYVDYSFAVDVQLETILIILFSLFSMNVVMSFYSKRKISIIRVKQNSVQTFDVVFLFVTKRLMLLSFVPIMYRKFLELKLLQGHAYSDVYLDIDIFSSIPFYLTGWGMIFQYSFYIYIISRPHQKSMVRFSTLFVIVQFMEALKGGRADLIIAIFLCVGFYSYYYTSKISIKHIVFSFVMIIFSQVISSLRSFKMPSSDILDNVYYFFIEQGSSLNILTFNLLYRDSYISPPSLTIFSPIIDGVMSRINPSGFSGMSTDLVSNSVGLGVQLPASLNMDFFLLGFGTGGSSLAEMYNFGGLFGVAIFSGLLIFLCFKFELKIQHNKLSLFLLIPCIQNLFFSPRGSFFPGIVDLYSFLYMYILFLIIKEFLKLYCNKNLKLCNF